MAVAAAIATIAMAAVALAVAFAVVVAELLSCCVAVVLC